MRDEGSFTFFSEGDGTGSTGVASEGRPYTVSEITAEVKRLLEESLPPIWIEGEISSFTHHSSGHRYLTLKDELSQIRCVMWRRWGDRLLFTPEVGMKVLACGDISVYERSGQYQFYVSQLQPSGVGELQLAFERLRARLAEEGLFDDAHKRALPEFPERIGVVTSPSGAAIRDIVDVLNRRFPSVEVVLRPANVQGAGAAEEIARAIEEFNVYSEVDLVIVGRGGGSPEDLWAFNEEVVARAIFDSRIPVISAVGHEIDFTIADFVADLRAPTPSAAAELAVKDREELLRGVRDLRVRATEAMARRLERDRLAFENLSSSYVLRRFEERVDQRAQRVDDLESALATAFDRLAVARIVAHRELSSKLDALSPFSAFGRGFSMCEKLPERAIVRDSAQLAPEDRIRVRFAKGSAMCEVVHTEDPDCRE